MSDVYDLSDFTVQEDEVVPDAYVLIDLTDFGDDDDNEAIRMALTSGGLDREGLIAVLELALEALLTEDADG